MDVDQKSGGSEHELRTEKAPAVVTAPGRMRHSKNVSNNYQAPSEANSPIYGIGDHNNGLGALAADLSYGLYRTVPAPLCLFVSFMSGAPARASDFGQVQGVVHDPQHSKGSLPFKREARLRAGLDSDYHGRRRTCSRRAGLLSLFRPR